MRYKSLVAALTDVIMQEGHEMDGTDRLLIRKTLSETLAFQHRRENQLRSTSQSFSWRRPLPRRQ